MRVYIIKDSDIALLREKLKHDPRDGVTGSGGNARLTPEQEQAANNAQRFYNFHVEEWLLGVMRGDRGTPL